MRPAQRRREILAEIAALGPVLPGSIVERSTRCQGAGCRCRADPPRLHGPYATWMHQDAGRQVTRTLKAGQASVLQPYLEANRRLRQLLAELEQVNLQMIDEKEGTALSRPRPVGRARPKGGK